VARFQHHIFICQNTREAGHARGSCNPAGDQALLKPFKDALKKYGLDATVRANKSGCLDQCEHGPTVVIYPDAIWYGGVTAENAEEIVAALSQGRVVGRLALKDGCIHTASCEHKPDKNG
jgi:(2Fe-2S) ferredoxin